MSTSSCRIGVAELLFGRVRSAVLSLLYLHSDQAYYLRQLVRHTGMGHGAVQRELALLHQCGLFTQTRRGQEVYYQANTASPLFAELRGLFVKTAGATDLLRTALDAVADRIAVAFIFGSIAKGTETATSDIDLLVIGEVGFGEVGEVVHPVQAQLGREVNPTVYAPAEVRTKFDRHDHFLTTLAREAKVFLIGDERDFTLLGAERLAHRAPDESAGDS